MTCSKVWNDQPILFLPRGFRNRRWHPVEMGAPLLLDERNVRGPDFRKRSGFMYHGIGRRLGVPGCRAPVRVQARRLGLG